MRICLLSRYFDYRNAGIGRVSCEIRNRLVAMGNDVVTVSTNEESLVSYFKYTAYGIRSQIPDDCDVYHAITPMEGIWIPKSKSIVTYLDLIPVTHPERAGAGIGYSRIKNQIGQWYFGWAAKQSSKAAILVAISETTKQYMVDRLGVDNVRVVRLGIRDDLQPIPSKDHKLRIGYLGQLDRRKRVNLLIDAFRESELDAELVIAGAGRDESLLKSLASYDHRIQFAGFIPDEEICEFYNSLDIFVFPTWIEGYGLPIVEAMACGKPVVVLSDAILPSEIQSRCFVAQNLTGLFSSLNRIDTVLRTNDYDGNLHFAREHWWDKCVTQYVELYKKIMEDGK